MSVLARSRVRSRIVSRAVAQTCAVKRVPSFLDAADIAAVRRLRDTHALTHGPAKEVRRGWKTTYLNADGLIRTHAPELLERLRGLIHLVDSSIFANASDQRRHASVAEEMLAALEPRCVEYHACTTGGALQDPGHFDSGSVVTIDVMLGHEFQGGAFLTREADGTMTEHRFALGDALIFPSYKYHTVSPVTAGLREVMVVEWWNGDAKDCNHRCEVARGNCGGDGRC